MQRRPLQFTVAQLSADDDIVVRAGQKVLVLGMNGSGKSWWAHDIAASWTGSIVVLDTKGDDAAALVPNCTIVHTAEEAVKRIPGHVVYRPSLAEKSGPSVGGLQRLWARWELVCRKVWSTAAADRRPTLVVVHELAEVCSAHKIGPAFRELITAGRSYGITLVLVTQRPQHTAVVARSEAQHVVAFALPDHYAREEAARLLSDPERPEYVALIRQRSLPLDHRWWYRGPDFRLRLHEPIALR